MISPAIRHIGYYGVGLFMMKGLSILMLPFLTHQFTVDQIGKLELLATISTFSSILIGLAMHEVLYRFVGHLSEMAKKKVANQIYVLALVIGALFFPVTLLGSTLIVQYSNLLDQNELIVLCFGLLIEAAIGVSLCWLRMQDRAKHFVWVTCGTALLQIGLILLSVWQNTGVIGVLVSSVVAHTLQLVTLHILNAYTWQLPDKDQIRKFLSYSLPLTLSGLLAFSLNGFEKWILGGSSSLLDLAIYAIATKFALAMCILVQPFGLWWMPKRFCYLEQKGLKATTELTQYGIVWIMMLCSGIAYAAPFFIQNFLPISYLPASSYVLIALAIAMLKEIAELTNIGLLYNKLTRPLLFINVCSAVLAISLTFGLRGYGVWGILFALFVAQLVRCLAISLISQHYQALSYKTSSLLLLLFTVMTHLTISYNIENTGYLLLMAFLAPISVLIFAYLLGIIKTVEFSLSALNQKKKMI